MCCVLRAVPGTARNAVSPLSAQPCQAPTRGCGARSTSPTWTRRSHTSPHLRTQLTSHSGKFVALHAPILRLAKPAADGVHTCTNPAPSQNSWWWRRASWVCGTSTVVFPAAHGQQIGATKWCNEIVCSRPTGVGCAVTVLLVWSYRGWLHGT